ncbi:LacI family DNA-binding transcriptional regulator [Sphingobacterium sp. SGR-19]|uniref:LacI family DNA-binding transcriptional regulator n=1 Tax=Sphingobacterium sp. SGR-19 TaxID=2710886 RepID=UPI0013EBF86C|nr:LacI family DNA-binding transcriptional regulator [Sphingobacterium sp. SGR-19]NGM65764.1 LacI family transcriptional regulator [Sphingobacterium sp. SGR-19]
MSNKKTSINDIAKHLNVAKSTVSFIINGKAEAHRISKKQEQRVLAYIKEIGYKPNYIAKSLATGKTNSIGLIVENIGDSFFGPIALMIEERAKKSGYRIIYSSTRNNTDDAVSVLQLFKDTHVDGFIIAPPVQMEEAITEVIHDKVPVVIFDRMLEGMDTDYVGTNNREVVEEACEHLLEQKFKNIAFISLTSPQSQMRERLEGYLQAMRKKEQTPTVLQMPYDSDRESYTSEIIHFLQTNPAIDAVFFATNYLCISGLEAIREMGKKIPDDIGIIAFDEHDLFRLFSPSITAIVQPLEQLSTAIIKILLDRIDKGSIAPHRHITIPSTFVIRESSVKKS